MDSQELDHSELRSRLYSISSLILPIFILLYVGWRLANKRFIELAEKIPGPPGLPIIGNALELRGTPNEIFENLYSKSEIYPDVARVWAGPRLLVFLTNPADIEIVLSSHDHLDKSAEYDFLRPWLGNGLLVSTGEKWRSHRKIIAPTFHLNVLRSFMERFNRNSKKTLERLAKEGDNEFDIHDYMSEFTVEVLIETVMGVKKENEGRSCFDYAQAVMKLCDIVHLRHTKFYLRPDLVFYSSKYGSEQKSLLSVIHGLTEKVLKVKKAQFENKIQDKHQETAEKEVLKETSESKEGFSYGQASGLKDDLDVEDIGEKKRNAFLESILERAANNDSINDKEVKEQLDTIMFEGHDTTAAASSFFLCMMAAHPDIQQKCYEEIMRVLGDSDRDITFNDILEMKYLERCLMETLRLYPPVPIIARQPKKEFKLASKNLIIPANCTVVIGIIKLHRRADIYPNPEKFDPDNFLPEKSASRHYYSFIPFSAGPRSCVGRKYAMLKLKTILASTLRAFYVKPGYTEEEWKLKADIILKRADGFRIKLEPRKETNAKN
ncbi:unnamed protein product [Nezara viridula]|uniref:Cytochrome P450 n=1 Tax=Nezara viridula TaxID=85310 RepID=A0A9P0MR52_NEZVI|nr:unnamed protein product [Nezara viridula]